MPNEAVLVAYIKLTVTQIASMVRVPSLAGSA